MNGEFNFREESPEVYYAGDSVPVIGPKTIDFLKAKASQNARLRCRLCTHASPDSRFHEMLIVHRGDSYFHPHAHIGRAQSFHVLEGALWGVVFEQDGSVRQAIDLRADDAAFPYYLRIPEDTYYSFVIRSDWMVILETTTGPFEPDKTMWAPWAPTERDPASASYSRDLEERVGKLLVGALK